MLAAWTYFQHWTQLLKVFHKPSPSEPCRALHEMRAFLVVFFGQERKQANEIIVTFRVSPLNVESFVVVYENVV